MADPIYNSEDVIDSRDIIERVEELENDVSVLQDEINGMESEFKELVRDDDQEKRDELGSNIDNSKDEIEDINDELKPLRLLMTDGENYNSDFHSGATLINNDYFEDYAYELACDIGAVDRKADWPISCIDWTAAADALKVDYACIDFDDNEFWIRCT